MRHGKVLSFLIVLLLPTTALATFPIDWNFTSIGGGWSCQNYTHSGQFLDTHYVAESTSGTPDPSYAFKITFPQGWPAGGPPASCWNVFGSAKSEIYGQFYFKWSTGYTWNGTVNKIVYIGYGPDPDPPTAGDVIGVVSQKIQFRTQYAETVNYSSNTNYNPTINDGTWYKVTWYQKINTPGVNDGIAKIWINDTLVMHHTNVKWRRSGDAARGFYELSITPVYGGGTTSGVVKPKDEYLWIDRTIVQSTPISGESLPINPINKVPMVPTELDIR